MWKAHQWQRNGNVGHNGDEKRKGNGRGVGGREWGKLGQYHRGSNVNLNLTLFYVSILQYYSLRTYVMPKPSIGMFAHGVGMWLVCWV